MRCNEFILYMKTQAEVRIVLENSFFRKLLYANTFIWICVTFTLATLIDLILTVAVYGDVGTTYYHLGTRFVLCTFVSVSLLVFRYFKKLPFILIIGIHFLAFLIFAVCYTWIIGYFVEQHPQAMFYMVRTVLIIYLPIGFGIIVIDFVMKKWRSQIKQRTD